MNRTDIPPLIIVALEIEAAALRRALPKELHARIVRVGPCARAIPGTGDLPGAPLAIAAGIAGGLDPNLRTGDVVVDGQIQPPRGARTGTVHTADRISPTPQDKSGLRARTGADAVEMELAHIRAALEPRGTPVAAVRAVADTAADTLPAFMERLVTPDGRSRPAAAIAHLLRKPTDLPALLRAAKQSDTACRAMAAAVAEILNHDQPTQP